jgi:glutamate-1-semialdehyde 2,1-aminomutase
LAALQLLDDSAYAQLDATAARLAEGLGGALAGKVRVNRVGPLVGVFAGEELPVDYEQARGQDEATYAEVFHGLLDRGVALAPGAYEVLFPGLTHTDTIVDEVVGAAEEVGGG